MATEIGIIKTLIGTAVATGTNGAQRTLQAGDRIFQDEVITTGPAGAVEVEFSDGSVMTLGRNSQAVLDNETFSPQDIAQPTVDADVEALQQALLEGGDLSQIADATAAGAGTSGESNEGVDIVQILHEAPEVTPDAGFETTGVNVVFEEGIEEDAIVDGVPTAGTTTVLLDEDDLGGEDSYAQYLEYSVLEAAFEADTGFSASRANTQGVGDEVEGDDLPPGALTVLSGNLATDFGSNGAGDISFNAAASQPSGLFSGGDEVQYWISEDGHSLIGYVLHEEGGQIYFRVESLQQESSYAEIIFTAEITDIDSGAFQVSLYGQVDHATPEQDSFEDNVIVNLGFTVSDSDGDTAEGVLRLDIDDDVPTIDVALAEAKIPTLTTQDADTIGEDSDVDSDSFAGLFTLTSDMGADDDGVAPSLSYALSVTDAASGLSSDGEAITLAMNNGVLEGSTTTGGVIFAISVDAATGEVTLTQHAEIDHVGEGDDSDAFNNDVNNLGLAAGNVVLTASATITDGDGDSATDSQAVDISGSFSFDDDLPAVDVIFVPAKPPILTTQDADTIGQNSDVDSGSFAGLFTLTSDMGADDDGVAPSLSYALSVDDPESGLSSDGEAITLAMNNGVLEGSTTTGGVIFAISVDAATGEVTLTQHAEIDHVGEGDDQDAFNNDVNNLGLAAAGNVVLTASATITDGDGDSTTDSQAVLIGGVFSFDDDTPVVTEGQSTDVAYEFTVTNHDEVSSAGYHSSYGYYIKDAVTGEPTTGLIIWDDVHDTDTVPVTITGYSPDQIGFFIIPNGDNNNGGLTDNTEVTFSKDVNGDWQAFDGLTPLTGNGSHVIFDGASLNKDEQDHVEDNNLTGNQNWEDLQIPSGDGDYNDVNINVDWTAVTVTGDVIDTVLFGADGPGSIDFSFSDEDITIDGTLTSNGESISFEAVDRIGNDGINDTIVGSADGEEVLTIAGILDGDYDVSVLGPIDDDNGDADVDIAANITVTDGDGDAVSSVLTISLNIDANNVLNTQPSYEA